MSLLTGRGGAPRQRGAPSARPGRGAAACGRLLRVLRDLASPVPDETAPVALAPSIPARTILRRFWPYARPHRALIVTVVLLAIGSSVLATASIGLFKVLVDRVLVPRDLAAFWWVALAYVGLTLLTGVVGFARRTLAALAGERFVLDLRHAVFDRAQQLSLAFFEAHQLGDITSRVTGNIKSIERLVVSGVFRFLTHALRIVFFTAALFYLQWQLALAALIAVPAFAWLARRFSIKIKHAARERTRRSGAVSAVVTESLANIELVQAYNRQDAEIDRFDEQNQARFRAKMASTRLRAAYAPLVGLVELVGTLLVAGLGTYELAAGRLTLGGLLAFAAYLGQLYRPVRRLGSLTNTAYAAAAGAERVLEVLDAQPAVRDATGARTLRDARGRICFDAVGFTYPGTTRPALREVSFTAEPGHIVAVTGASGAGKSSLVKLLLRFYDPQRGTITVDGHDLRQLTTHSLRENIAVLLQENLVFDGTIGENIAYGLPGATTAAVHEAARDAGLSEVVAALPEGYDTVIGQRGRRLSGGQRQRVAIARAMIRRAPVLILDEPTTGLDPVVAARILDPLHRLMRRGTTLLISHDPAVIDAADTVCVLDGGRMHFATPPGTAATGDGPRDHAPNARVPEMTAS